MSLLLLCLAAFINGVLYRRSTSLMLALAFISLSHMAAFSCIQANVSELSPLMVTALGLAPKLSNICTTFEWLFMLAFMSEVRLRLSWMSILKTESLLSLRSLCQCVKRSSVHSQ